MYETKSDAAAFYVAGLSDTEGQLMIAMGKKATVMKSMHRRRTK